MIGDTELQVRVQSQDTLSGINTQIEDTFPVISTQIEDTLPVTPTQIEDTLPVTSTQIGDTFSQVENTSSQASTQRTRHRSRRLRGLPPIPLDPIDPPTPPYLVSTFIQQIVPPTSSIQQNEPTISTTAVSRSNSVQQNESIQQSSPSSSQQNDCTLEGSNSTVEVQDIPPTSNTNTRVKWGLFHCPKYKDGGRCYLCSHMIEKDKIESYHFGTSSRIHGQLCHTESPDGYIRSFIFCIQDLPCRRQIVGSTSNPTDRW